MSKFLDILKSEPVAITGFVTAVVNVLMATNVIDVTGETVASINVAIGALFAMLRFLVFSPKTVETIKADTYDDALDDVRALSVHHHLEP